MDITIRTVPHNSQRYPTAADWEFLEDGSLRISVSATGSWESEVLVAIHELVEAVACKKLGIAEKDVCEFDVLNPQLIEPGESPLAPYHQQHVTAEIVERIAAQAMGVNWQDHDALIDALFE